MADDSFLSSLVNDFLKRPGLLDLARRHGIVEQPTASPEAPPQPMQAPVGGDFLSHGLPPPPAPAEVSPFMRLAHEANAAPPAPTPLQPQQDLRPALAQIQAKQLPDLQFPPEDIDPKTGVSYERFNPEGENLHRALREKFDLTPQEYEPLVKEIMTRELNKLKKKTKK